MRKLVIWMLVLIVIGGAIGGYFYLRNRAAQATSQEILKSGQVTEGDLVMSVSSSGTVKVIRQTQVAVASTGYVAQVLVAVNDRVAEGQTLAVMDTADLTRAVNQAQIALEQAQLARSQALAPADPGDVEVAQVGLDSAAKALEVARLARETARVNANATIVQAQRQREQAFITWRDAQDWTKKSNALDALHAAEAREQIAHLQADQTMQQAESQYQAAYTAYVQAQTSLDNLNKPPDETTVRQQDVKVEQAQISLDQAQRALSDATIRAPYAGRIAQVDLKPGMLYATGQPAFIVIDDSAYLVDLTIDEIDIGAVTVGQTATLALDAYPDVSLPCEVDTIDPASTNVSGLVSYDVRLTLLNTGRQRILDGMSGTATIVTRIVPNVLRVPNWAIQVDQATGETYCYTLVNGQPQKTTITLGLQNETYSQVLSGLAAGDTVVVITPVQQPSLFGLRPGSRSSGLP